MQFSELLLNRRSIRNFQDKPVPLDLITTLITESTLAPNAGNEQIWKYLIINNKDLLKRISDESKKNILYRVNNNPGDYAEKYRGLLENPDFNVYYGAPCAVFILGESNVRNLHADCALAASYFMLAAADRGLGTCWINLGKEIKDPAMIKKLGIPEGHIIVAPLALGYPVKIPAIPRRNDPVIVNIVE